MSYLPELRSYLDDLLRTRERLQAMAAADDWAKREAMPSEEEICHFESALRALAVTRPGGTGAPAAGLRASLVRARHPGREAEAA